MKIFDFVSVLALSSLVAVAQDTLISPAEFSPSGHIVDSVQVVKQRIQDKTAVLIDVREEDEWSEGHLLQAKLIPLSVRRAGQLSEDQKKMLPRDKPIYCHCASGGRVLTAAKILRPMGYDLRPLKLGYEKLVSEGFEKAPEANP